MGKGSASTSFNASFRSSLAGLNVPVAVTFHPATNDLYVLNNVFGAQLLLSRSSAPYDSYSHIGMGPGSLSSVIPGITIVPPPPARPGAYIPMSLDFQPGSQDLYFVNGIYGTMEKAISPYNVSTTPFRLGTVSSIAFHPTTKDFYFSVNLGFEPLIGRDNKGIFSANFPAYGKPFVTISDAYPARIAFHPTTKDLYFSNDATGTISRAASPYTAPSQVVIPSAGTVTGLAVDSEGYIYTSEASKHVVRIYQNNGTLLQTLGTLDVSGSNANQFNRPGSLKLNADNTILAVADTGNARVVLFSISRTSSTSVTVSAVPTAAKLKSLGLRPDLASAVGSVLLKNPKLAKVFSGLTGTALEEAVKQTQPQGSSPGATVSGGAMSTSQGNVSGQQSSARSDFQSSQKNYANYSVIQLENLQKLKDENNLSQFKSLEFFAQGIQKPGFPTFHDFDEKKERSLPASVRIRGRRINMWIQNNNQVHNTANHNGFIGMHSFTRGGTTGIDYRINDKFLLGFMGGGSFTTYNLRVNQGSGEVKSIITGIYGTVNLPANFYVDGSFIVGRNHYKNNRNINLPDLPLVASESHKGTALAGNIRVGVLFLVRRFEISPYLGVGYMRAMENSYTETNAGDLNLTVMSQRNQFLQTEAGIKCSKDVLVNGTAWNPSASFGVTRDQAYNVKSKVKASFAGQGTNFVVNGNNSKRNQASTSLALAVVMPSGTYFNISYNTKFNRSEQTQEAVVRVGKKF